MSQNLMGCSCSDEMSCNQWLLSPQTSLSTKGSQPSCLLPASWSGVAAGPTSNSQAQGTRGCGEDLSLPSWVDFLPTSSHFLMSALSSGKLLGVWLPWQLILYSQRKINPGVWYEEWLHHFHSPNDNYFTTRNSFFWIEHLFHPGTPSYNANSPQ